MLTLTSLGVHAGSKEILKNISYTFEDNKTYILIGPNGSGKSTLAYAVAGHPQYGLDQKSKIKLDKTDITHLSPDQRAKLGIFLSFQSPLSLQGVTVFQLLRVALQGKIDPFILKQDVMRLAKKLKIPADIIDRSLNQGSSGGEKKKIEVLQAGILAPKVALFDEVDTGVDIDALKTISSYMTSFKKNRTIIFITHNLRILKYIKADRIIILKNGCIVKEGDRKLLTYIEKNGFEKL